MSQRRVRFATGRLLTGLVCALTAGLVQAGDVPSPDYATLKARLAAGDTTVDFRALRFAHAASAEYLPNSPDSLVRRKLVQDALEAGRFAEAATLLEKWLAADFLNPFAHLGAVRAYRELGNEDKAKFHDAVVDGLFASICARDEGLSEDRPCPVLSIDEQHFFLVMNGFTVQGEYGTDCSGQRPCQVYEVRKLNTNEAFTLYFDISRPLAFRAARHAAGTPAQNE